MQSRGIKSCIHDKPNSEIRIICCINVAHQVKVPVERRSFHRLGHVLPKKDDLHYCMDDLVFTGLLEAVR